MTDNWGLSFMRPFLPQAALILSASEPFSHLFVHGDLKQPRKSPLYSVLNPCFSLYSVMAELGLAIAGLAASVLLPVITELETSLLDRIQHQGEEYYTLTALVINISKSQTHEILSALSGQDDTIPEDFRAEIDQMFQQLRGIFEELLSLIPDPSDKKHRKVTNKSQKRIDNAIKRLEEWNDRFFKRALVYALFGRKRHIPPIISDEDGLGAVALGKVERLRDAVAQSLEKTTSSPRLLLPQPTQQPIRRPLPNSALRLVGPAAGASPETFLVEFRTYTDDATPDEVDAHRRITRDVAAIMNQADPRLMGILHCRGFAHDVYKNRFELHFSVPEGFANPRSLLDVFRDPSTRQGRGAKHSLDQRVDLAKGIVSALFVLHSADLVHKQVRPDNIIIFESTSPDGSETPSSQRYPYTIGRPFLVGFDSARRVDAASHMLRVEEWDKNLYLSPERHDCSGGTGSICSTICLAWELSSLRLRSGRLSRTGRGRS